MDAWKSFSRYGWVVALAVGIVGCQEEFIRDVVDAAGEAPEAYREPGHRGSKPSIVTFEFRPREVPYGASTTLYWDTRNADDVYITDLGRRGPRGSERMTPKLDTEYRIEAKNAYGSASKGATAESPARYPLRGQGVGVTVDSPTGPPIKPSPDHGVRLPDHRVQPTIQDQRRVQQLEEQRRLEQIEMQQHRLEQMRYQPMMR